MFDDVNMVRWMLGVLSLILMFGSLIVILKRLQQSGKFAHGFTGFNSLRPQGRLQVTETLNIDTRRKLIIVEDGTEEHVILLGTTQELLVSSRPAAKKAAKATDIKPQSKSKKAS